MGFNLLLRDLMRIANRTKRIARLVIGSQSCSGVVAFPGYMTKGSWISIFPVQKRLRPAYQDDTKTK